MRLRQSPANYSSVALKPCPTNGLNEAQFMAHETQR
jgi:hypothetical protein